MSQPVLTGTPLNNQAVVINSIRLLLLLTAENYSHGTYSLTYFTGKLPLSLTAAQLEQQLRGQMQLSTQKQRDRKSSQGVPCFIRRIYNPIVFLRIEHIKSFLDVVGIVQAFVHGDMCWRPCAALASLRCPEFISFDESNRTTSLQSL